MQIKLPVSALLQNLSVLGNQTLFLRAFCPEPSMHEAAGVEVSLPLMINKDQLWWMPWPHSFLARLAPVLLDTLSLVESLQFATGHSSSWPCLTALCAPWWTFALHQCHRNTRFQRAQEPRQSGHSEKISAVSLFLKALTAMVPSSSQVPTGTVWQVLVYGWFGISWCDPTFQYKRLQVPCFF